VFLPKEGFTKYVKTVKTLEVISLCTPHVEVFASTGPTGFYENSPYPTKIEENHKMLNVVTRKSNNKNCIPNEKVQVQPHVSALKELT
jgi:hypothetical protein